MATTRGARSTRRNGTSLIPKALLGRYDVPGWTANGVEPWGLQMDPVGADGNLFYKGWFLVVLGLHLYVTGDEKWNRPFDITRDGDNTFTWTHSRIAEHLFQQMTARPEGCHCENTKIWTAVNVFRGPRSETPRHHLRHRPAPRFRHLVGARQGPLRPDNRTAG